MRFDLPAVDDETRPFWDAARDGQLLIKRCAECGTAHFYPRPFCPVCWSTAVSWEPASGDAVLYTWSVVYHNDLPPFSDGLPYVAAVVDLAEGPRMVTNVVACDPGSLRVGMALRVAYREIAERVAVPVFAPA